MNALSDELLNKFIDNELDQATLKVVREELQRSEEGRKRLRALQLVHNKLRNMEAEAVSPQFTPMLMKKIMRRSKANKEQRFFILSVSSIFVIIALGILGYIASLIFSAPQSAGGTVSGAQETVNIIENLVTSIKNLLKGANISTIGSVFSLGLLISIYFVMDLIKHKDRNLSKQH
jgi:anti-sigma factor RsiW